MFVTYNAPQGDDKVVTFCGVEFFAGHPVELDAGEHSHLIAKARGNPHFEVSEEAPESPAETPRRGRGRAKAEEADA